MKDVCGGGVRGLSGLEILSDSLENIALRFLQTRRSEEGL